MSWEKVRLGNVCDVRDGTHNSPKYYESGFPLVTSRNIKDGKLDLIDVNYISEADFNEINRRSKVEKGDILLPMIGTIGNPIILNDEPNFAIKNVCLLKKSDKILNTFLYYILVSDLFKENLFDKSKGGTQKFISLGDIRDFQVPLPPLPIQKRIAEILDAADALKRKDQELLKKYDDLAQAIFIEMFGDIENNAKRWEKVKLNHFISKLETGVSVNSEDSGFAENKSCVLKTSCVFTGIFRPEEAKVIVPDEIDRAKLNPTINSIIISRMNTPELVGMSAYVDKDYSNLFLPDRLWMTVKTKVDYSVLWLSYALKSVSIRKQILKVASGTSGSMKNIAKPDFLNLDMINPPYDLQVKFELSLKHLNLLKTNTGLKKSENLFNSLIQKAFKGELVS